MAPSDFPEAYARFLAPIRAKCRRLLGSGAAADDAAQEALVRLWQSGPPIDGTTDARQLLAWLYLTATRIALDALRQGRWVAAEVSEVPVTSGLASPLDVTAARSLIVALCCRAEPAELEAALLARVDGLTQPEVALVLGVSERTVRRLLESFDRRSQAFRKELGS
jgi:RNA polymerase sigma-70 factor (ECF subfamily)